MKFGFSLIMRGSDATPDNFVNLARRAEGAGVDSLWCSAHIIVPPQGESHYANIPGRKHGEHWVEGYWEPFTVISYLAAHTQRITLGTSIVVLPMHSPFEVAKQVAEVDQLTKGRFVFGIGVGWLKSEFEVLGRDFHNRGARTDDALKLMARLWSDEDPVTYQGKYYQVTDGWFSPKPVQRPRPPIWVAGSSEATFRRAAHHADAWHPVIPSFELLAQGQARLRELCQAAGRPADAVQTAAKLPLLFQDGPPAEGQMPTQGRPQDILDAIRRYEDAGVSHIVFDFVPERMDNAMETIDRFAADVLPKL